MKPTAFAAACALSAALVAAPAAAEPVAYSIDPTHTTVAFMVEHVGYADTLGLFREIEGTFVFNEAEKTVTNIEVTVPAASVWTNHEKRDAHVRNADFLDAEAHPMISFTADGGEVTGDNTGTVTGDLTIRGQTNPVTLDVTLNKSAPYPFAHKKQTIGVSARATIKRSEWGMDYAVANGLVGDDVELLIEFEAIADE